MTKDGQHAGVINFKNYFVKEGEETKPTTPPTPPKKTKPATKKEPAKSEGTRTVTRATNLYRARKCQSMLPEWQKAYATSKPINHDGRYVWRYNECAKKGTPIPNGPKPKKGVKPRP